MEWGYKCIGWRAVAERNEHKQGYVRHLLSQRHTVGVLTPSSKLLRGLEFLHKLDQATTYQERREVLGDPVPRTNHMLGTTLWKFGSTVSGWLDWYYFWDHLDTAPDSRGCPVNFGWYTNGPDVYGSSPFRMWRLSHKDCWRQDVIAHPDHTWLRRCGYVFWDFQEGRVADRQLRRFISGGRRKAWLDRFRCNDGELKSKMRRSRRERADIYKRGGRGYWSEKDLSQIIWTEGAPS